MYTCGIRINAKLVEEGSSRINAKLVKEELKVSIGHSGHGDICDDANIVAS